MYVLMLKKEKINCNVLIRWHQNFVLTQSLYNTFFFSFLFTSFFVYVVGDVCGNCHFIFRFCDTITLIDKAAFMDT